MQYDDDDNDDSGKCLMVEGKFKGKFKSPKADTVSITNSHITDTASNSYKSLTTDTDLKTTNNPINGLITHKPKTLPLAHKSNQSLIIDNDSTKTHHTKSCYFTDSNTCYFTFASKIRQDFILFRCRFWVEKPFSFGFFP